MADPYPAPDTGSDTSGAPRWVKVFGIIALVVVLLLVILMLTSGPGGHGPGRHAQSDAAGGDRPHVTVTEHGVQQP